jgi:hypothetical protein
MRILVACEFSGTVRDAFRRRGHDAWSCDLLPCRVPGPHFQGDVFRAIQLLRPRRLIVHPPCTFLCGSGLHWIKRGRIEKDGRPRREHYLEALDFVRLLLAADVEEIALENPVGAIGTQIRPANQSIQPYEFGEDASKRTCLWLKGLPTLAKDPAKRFAGRLVEWPRGSGKIVERWSNQTDSGQNALGPSEDRWAVRSLTYPGIAEAMAEQWK